MGVIKNEYKSFLDDIEKNIKNKEDLEYIKKRFASFVDVIESLEVKLTLFLALKIESFNNK